MNFFSIYIVNSIHMEGVVAGILCVMIRIEDFSILQGMFFVFVFFGFPVFFSHFF